MSLSKEDCGFREGKKKGQVPGDSLWAVSQPGQMLLSLKHRKYGPVTPIQSLLGSFSKGILVISFKGKGANGY